MNSAMQNPTNFQPGIVQPLSTVARYLTFVTMEPGKARNTLQRFSATADGTRCVAGLGASLVETLNARIPGLRPFPTLAGNGVVIPATPGALWCWLRGDDRGNLILHARKIAAQLAPAFNLVQSIDAFKYDTGRDLTGYEDGTENPTGDDALSAAIVTARGSALNGSSFVAVQQWLHDMDSFEALAPQEQDDAVGRRKHDNEELPAAPESAHVKRTAQESFSPEAFVLRRSMPWSHDSQLGLLFTAFGHSLDAFEVQLRRMVGLDDGIVDGLFKFSRPITGNYYWCPPLRGQQLDLSALEL